MPLAHGSYVDGSRTIEGGGTEWVVREASWISPSGEVSACLIFENDAAVRCVRAFPDDWRTCGDSDLYELSLVF